MRLDNFQSFVHQCCGIDSDLSAHVPGRMLHRFGDSRLLDIALFQVRNGPPDAVSTIRRTSSRRSPRRH